MDKKFIRLISPPTLIVTLLLDLSIVYFGYFSVKKFIEGRSFYSVMFLIVVTASVLIAVFVTKEIIKQGIIFRADEAEFTALDDNNIIKYADIEKIEAERDDKASLVKNFNDRQSKLIFTLREDKIITIEIGMTTKRALNKIKQEFENRI